MTWASVSSCIPNLYSISRSINQGPSAQPRFGSLERKEISSNMIVEHLKEQDEAIKQLINTDFLLKTHILEVGGIPSDFWPQMDNIQNPELSNEGLQPTLSNEQLTIQLNSRTALLKQLSARLESMTRYLKPGYNTDDPQAVQPAVQLKNPVSHNTNEKDETDRVESNWTPKNERTRFKVLMDLGKQYITRGPLLSDSLWSVGIGAVLAIGSPVMAVTIPTTFAFFLAGRAALALMHFCQDPKGNSIDAKYQKWIEKDAEKLKKQEESRASE